MNISLKGKNAVVCGSSQGIGQATAEELAGLGANCILLARNEVKLKKVVDNLDKSQGQRHQHYSIDFNNRETVRELMNRITSQQSVHILVNNSGGPAAGPIVEAKEEQFLQAFQQHLLVNHLLVLAVKEGMKKENYGRIINIISTSVKIPLPNLGVSNTIRGAVASWARTMANELGRFGITVNNILPGLTRTERLDALVTTTSAMQNKTREEVERHMMEEVPAKRFGEAHEIGAMAAFLATPAAAYVNGTSIRVDGGRTGSI